MECNKDEAVRAKELAAKKFLEKNYASAKKFLVKAQTLYPELDGLAQILTIYDVYISAETKINGEVDWYGILGVTPFADDETIKKQYRRLAFIFHPDKNKSVGAEGAFKLVSEAWRLLSDKNKRLAYNKKRNLKGPQQEVLSCTGVPSAKPSANIYQNVMNTATSNARAQPGPNLKVSQQEVSSRTGVPSAKRRENTFKDVMNGATSNARAQPGPNLKGSQQEVPSRTGVPSKEPPANFQNVIRGATSNARAQPGLAPPSHGKAASFWTVCNECNTYYQYLKIYQNKALICPNCQKLFVATEKVPPADIFSSSSSSSFQLPKNSSHHAASAGNSFSSGRNSTTMTTENLSPADIFNSSSSSSFQQRQNSRHHTAVTGNSFSFGRNSAVAENLGAGGSLGPNSFNDSKLKLGSFSKMAGLGSTVASVHAGGGLVHPESDKGKRDVLWGQSISEWEKSQNMMGNSLLRKRSMDNSSLNGYEGYMSNRKSMGNDAADLGGASEVSTGNAGTKRIYGVSGKYNRPNVARELPYTQLRKTLIDKARHAICKVLEEQSSTTTMATENLSPAGIFNSSSSSSFQQRQNPRHHTAVTGNSFSFGRNSAVAQNLGAGGSLDPNSFNDSKLKLGSFSKMAGLGSTVASVHAGGGLVHPESDKGKRDVLWGQSISEWEKSQNLMGNSLLRKRSMDNSSLNGYEGYMSNRKSRGNDAADLGGVSEVSTGNAGTKRIYGVSGKYNRPNVARELPYPQLRKTLIDKARRAICKVLEEQSSTTADTTRNSDSDAAEEAKPPMTMNVPDPDFHNFDLDRTESCFKEEQIWAAYDDDGMPRFYARIHKVISLKPFKMQISWLNSRSNTELGPLNWIGSGFAKTCGDFRPGRHEIADTLNAFSNQVYWTKIARGVIRIFPRKGEVWALYRNWSPDWNEDTPDSVIEKYDMVEILDDFTEEHGVSFVPLSKVAGFRTVFRNNMDPVEVRRIPKEEMFRLSHRVPSHLLTGEEGQNAPKGCWELDPAAMPSELLVVIT